MKKGAILDPNVQKNSSSGHFYTFIMKNNLEKKPLFNTVTI